MPHLKAIIFDVDGTLANTEEIHRQAFNAAFKEFDLPFQWSVQEYTRLLAISGGKERIYHYLKSHEIGKKYDLNYWHEYSLAIHRRKSVIYREMLEAGKIILRSGINRLLDEAREMNIRIAIATCTSFPNVKTLLTLNLGEDALDRFDAIVTCDIVIDKKPSPAVYQFALAELGLTPEYCIAIEDTINGNQAALQAGLKTIITTHAYTIDNDFSGANLILDQLGEPDEPFTVIGGNAFGSSYVDINLLEMHLNIPAEEDQWQPAPRVAFAK